ncbi:hypothetical protein Nocox_14845 [Nonomuraea coxensis DSM 45129]|uniref:HTH merR-type domain-containing protein n=1 Tax=Nonomuraea coxensis DSM 45129 TaxID=1122611 RepID=A0ABX8U0B5_9ACTN|nr:helix-turn-helix domain-containing protein [Nonomuraea coxensis]QYC40584.1 hypothetical protein Nocox_14845 [Nonomuraea coxensis DSM 45129]
MSETWTIGELAEHAARALRDGAAPLSGRVRDVPGERLIRWYTTIGLLDPPLTRRGRVARYGRRHLLQLVAVKRLQAAGRSIADIQVALAGATDHTLEETASLPALPPIAPPVPPPAPPPVSPPVPPPVVPGVTRPAPPNGAQAGRGRFWADRPAAPGPANAGAATSGTADTATPGSTRAVTSREAGAAAGDTGIVTGISLGGGVRVVWDGGRVPSEEDVQAVLAAAGPLLAVLAERELT